MEATQFPCSPFDQIEGIVYFRRMCEKIRLHEKGLLHSDYHANLGRAMDLWCCQLLEVDYVDLVTKVHERKSDEEVLDWAFETGTRPAENLLGWWSSFMRNFGHKDDFSERLEERKADAGLGARVDIVTFFQFMDVEEGHR